MTDPRPDAPRPDTPGPGAPSPAEPPRDGPPVEPGGAGDGGAVPVRLMVWVRGRVQGVGFRWWTRATALEIGLVGFASNREDGRVQIVAEGSRERCERLLDWLRHGATPGRVDGVAEIWGPARGGYPDFAIR